MPKIIMGVSSFSMPLREKMQLEVYDQVSSGIGRLTVYKKRGTPQYFIMSLLTPALGAGMLKLVETLGGLHSEHLVRYHGHELDQGSCGEAVEPGLRSFWDYFNFNLRQLHLRRASHKEQYLPEEVWLVIKACCEIGYHLNQKGYPLDIDP
jgi:hypothetical protein